jgi:secreted trypsin-like serine protease
MKRVALFILVLVIACKGVQAQQKVTGGFPINITEAPWQVLLSVGCGGSIIAPNFILTAKHCVVGLVPSAVTVTVGITCKNEANSSNTFNVSQIILHPDPNVDAALLQLSSNITYNNNRQPVNYLSSVDNTLYNVGNETRVSGWGWTIPNNPGSTPNCLEAVNLNVISNQDASNVLRSTWGRDLYAHEMAVTGTGNIRQGACHGDSGGPLTTLTASNEPILIGIVEGGIPGCGGNNQNSPSVFTRVSHIRNWIQSVICPTPIVNFTNQIVTTNTTVTSCGDINVQNVKVQNGAKLILDAAGEVNIGSDFEVELGSEFEIK